MSLEGYCDSDYGGDLDDKKSTSSVLFFLGGNIVTKVSHKQKFLALSSREVEYISLTLAAYQGVWLADLIEELIGEKVKTVRIFFDNSYVEYGWSYSHRCGDTKDR